MTKFTKYHQTVAFLEKLAATRHDQGYMCNRSNNPEQYLERTREFVNRLNNPHQGFSYIHITGTAGKGSTVSYLHNILRKSGFRVGSFMSPYATTPIENIKVNNKLISANDFVKLSEKIKPIIKKMEKGYKYGRPSYFEILFGMAILYFKKMKCDWVILEAGCGGRYDAGNIISKSISAITNIGLDHTNLLGKTLIQIAYEKAGIIKPNTHFFTTEKKPRILKLFKKICAEKKATFHHIRTERCALRAPLSDPAQTKNIALAEAIARHINIDCNVIQKAVRKSKLPCRFEIMQKNPLIILDGAHNPNKIASVVHNLKNLTYGKLYTIFASANNKDAKTIIAKLTKVSHKIIFTKFDCKSKKAYTPEELAIFAKTFKNKSIEPDARKALKSTLKKLKKNDALLITGSFYLAGELRKHWINEEYILKNRVTNNTSS